MSESVSDSNGVKRKNDSQQDAQDVLSTSRPQPLLSSFLDKKNSDQEFLDNHDEKKVCSKTKPRSYRCSKCRQQGHNARTCPNVGKNDAANSETKCKRKFIRRKESKVEPINNAPQVVAKPVSNRLKHKTCNTCGISFRKNAKGKTSDCCLKCRIVDNYHPPIRIPQEIHPTKCNEFAFVFQRFLDQLCKGKYAINIIWEFFGSFCPPFEQNFVSNSEDLTNIAPRNQSSEKLSKIFEDKCFDNKWSKALSALSPGVKAPNNEDTVDKLKILHPYEDPVMDQNFYGTYWENYPLMPSEVFSVIKKRPRGKSAGLSGITIDHVKAAIISSEDCLGLLTKFFNQILSGQRKYPEELRSSRLTALVKNSRMDVRPIAVSESLHNIFSACCLSRFNEKAKKILLPFQYGINTTDGVSSAIFATDVLFRQNESNVCMSLDFSNAFNSLSRRSIHGALLQYMPELIPYFQSTYCTYSNLHFGNNILISSSGVKQGDPLGPLLFCLAIHLILLQIQEMFPSLKMIAYMDDVVLIGELNIVKKATVCFKELFTKIGLRLNLLKCVLLSNSPVSTIIDDIEIQAKLYSIDAIRHLGSFLGNNDEITKKLFEKLNSISDKIDRMMNLDIKKHIKFTIIRLCFSSNFNHIFRSTNPLVTRPLAQKFNELRAKVLSQLLFFFSITGIPQYGGLGWTKASILTSCAFVGGCRNAIFEFSERFADWEDLLMTTQSSTVFALNEEISRIDVEKWGRCFPQSFNGNIPEKNVLNLKYTLRTLQKRLTGISAVLNQDLHSLLLEKGVCENKVSDSSLFVTIVPRRFGLCATNEALVTKMRLYLNIPINQLLSKEKCICSNSPQLTLRHALNCSKLITYRSSLHDAVRDTVFNMAQTARISCIKEPLLKETLSLNNFGSDDRGDVYCDWIDNSEAIVDFVSCNVANDTLVYRRKLNPVAALDF
ncbi:hypothetical protein P9112_009435 [Eukaryota sp. TZLM1-RC]